MMNRTCMNAGVKAAHHATPPGHRPSNGPPARPFKPGQKAGEDAKKKKKNVTGATAAASTAAPSAGRSEDRTPSSSSNRLSQTSARASALVKRQSERYIRKPNGNGGRRPIPKFDPDEEEEDPTKGKCLVSPTAPFKMKWDIVMLFLILYNVIMVPVRICFEIEAPPGSAEFWVETSFDMLFIVDILINFNSAYHTELGLEVRRSKIANNYMRGWFLIDAPSSLPTEPVLELVKLAIPDLMPSADEGGGGSDALLLPKLLRFLRMARFMKLIRLLKAAKIFKILEEELELNMSVLKLFKLIFIVVFLGHILACAVFMINRAQSPDVLGMFRLPTWYGCYNKTLEEFTAVYPLDWSPSPGDATPEWPRKDDCSHAHQAEFRFKITSGELYVWTLYWTLTTMTTIGYGDFSPLTTSEALVTVFVEVAGASIFGYMIGNIASVIADFDQFGAVQKQRMDEIKGYLAYKKVPKTLSKAVRKYYGHYYSKRGVEALRQDWSSLPPSMKIELVKYENKEFVTQFPAFVQVGGYDFIERLVYTLRPVLVNLGEFVAGSTEQLVREKPSCELFLITSGEVHKLRAPEDKDEDNAGPAPSHKPSSEEDSAIVAREETRRSSRGDKVERVLRPGDWFGHDELIAAYDRVLAGYDAAEGCKWQHKYKARRVCELLYLIDGEFFQLLEDYPAFRYILTEGDEEEGEDDETESAPGEAPVAEPAAEIEEVGGCARPSAETQSTALALAEGSRPPPVAVPLEQPEELSLSTPVSEKGTEPTAPPSAPARCQSSCLASIATAAAVAAAATPVESAPSDASLSASLSKRNSLEPSGSAAQVAQRFKAAGGSGGLKGACGCGGMAAMAGGASKAQKPKCAQGAKGAAGGSNKDKFKGAGPGMPGVSKWSALKPNILQMAAAGGMANGGLQQHGQPQLDAQFLRQKIVSEVFGLPLRPAHEITDDEVLTLIRERCGLPAPTPLSTAASTPAGSVGASPKCSGIGALLATRLEPAASLASTVSAASSVSACETPAAPGKQQSSDSALMPFGASCRSVSSDRPQASASGAAPGGD